MKPLFVILIAQLVVFNHVWGQGTLKLSNLQPGQEILLPLDLGGGGPGASGSAQLALVPGEMPVGPVVGFFSEPGATQWLIPTDITLDGFSPGSTVTLVLWIWETAAGSFQEAMNGGGYWGETMPFDVTLGGQLPSGVVLPPGDTSNLVGIPEPSTASLAILGACLFFSATARSFKARRHRSRRLESA